MIDEHWTWLFYGYHSDELSHRSAKPVVAVCDDCYRHRIVKYSDYRDLCRHCVKLTKYLSGNTRMLLSESHIGSTHSDKTRLKMSISMTGIPHNPLPNPRYVTEEDRFLEGTQIDRIKTIEKYGYDPINISCGSSRQVVLVCKKCSKDRCAPRRQPCDMCQPCAVAQRYEDDPTLREKQSQISKKCHEDDPTLKERMSASQQGIPYEEWSGFSVGGEYCEKFDEACRERIRTKYDHRCFVCDRTQNENITKNGNILKLCVHHVDMNKNQGCDGVQWKLVSLCKSCHGKAHFEPMKSRINYLVRVE